MENKLQALHTNTPFSAPIAHSNFEHYFTHAEHTFPFSPSCFFFHTFFSTSDHGSQNTYHIQSLVGMYLIVELVREKNVY